MAYKSVTYYLVKPENTAENLIFNLHQSFPGLLALPFVIIIRPPEEQFSPFAF